MPKACQDCRFFKPDARMERATGRPGKCHRFPPQLATDSSFDQFPIVRSTDWCGEYQEKAA